MIGLAAIAAAGASASGDSGQARPAAASAQAYAQQDPSGARRDLVSVAGKGDRSGHWTHVQASTSGGHGSASAEVTLQHVDVFDGLVTADAVHVRAAAAGGGTSTAGSVSGLVIDGRSVPAPAGRTVYDVDGYGKLVALDSGATGVLGLRARLTKPYKTHKAGEVVRVAYASAKASDAVAGPAPATAPGKKPQAARNRHKRALTAAQRRLRKLRRRHRIAARRVAGQARALLALGDHVFPVAGKHDFTDTYGAFRADTGFHEGNDVFAPFGTPIVAVADGRLYRVGTLKISGNRLWLRDRHGYRFFYCHLSDFAASAYNGADVHAGEIIGFVGNTGDAEPTPPHLHFEVHMPDDTVVDPYRFLHKWDQRGVVSTAKWLRRYGSDPGVRPGALVVVKDFLAEP